MFEEDFIDRTQV